MNKILLLIWAHWFLDFFCQNDKMAINKSSSVRWLGLHCFIYGVGLCGFGVLFGLVNMLAHFIIDGISSKITSYLWQKGDRHNFFTVIGIDQAAHLTVLLLSAKYYNVI